MLQSTRTSTGSVSRPQSSSQSETGLRVLLFKNSAKSVKPSVSGVELTVRNKTSFAKFKRLCGKELKIRCRRLFQATGEEVHFLDEITQGSSLFVSQGEPFFKNKGGKEDSVVGLRFAVVGKGGVGKSAITLRYVRDFFVNFWDRTVEDAYQKTVDYNRQLYKLSILDTAGQDNFQSLRAQWMSEKDGYLFVFDKMDKSSLAELEPYYQLYSKLHPDTEVEGIKAPIILCGNKKDLAALDPSKEQISKQEGQNQAVKWGAHYMETSAKTNENIAEAFEMLVRINSEKSAAPKLEAGLAKCAIL